MKCGIAGLFGSHGKLAESFQTAFCSGVTTLHSHNVYLFGEGYSSFFKAVLFVLLLNLGVYSG